MRIPQLDEITLIEAHGDLPTDITRLSPDLHEVCIDTETSGLNWKTDQLALIQVYIHSLKTAYIIHPNDTIPHNLIALLSSNDWTKTFHFAMFDLQFLRARWNFTPANIRCTKIASKILSPTNKSHSLQGLLQTHLNIHIDKDLAIRTSDWLSEDLSKEQLNYAVCDVIYLLPLRFDLEKALNHTPRVQLTQQAFEFIPHQLEANMAGIQGLFEY